MYNLTTEATYLAYMYMHVYALCVGLHLTVCYINCVSYRLIHFKDNKYIPETIKMLFRESDPDFLKPNQLIVFSLTCYHFVHQRIEITVDSVLTILPNVSVTSKYI